MNVVLKVIGAIIVIWAAFWIIGAVFKILGTLLVIAAVATLGAVGYAAIKGRSQKQIGR
jgi:hypothetical protein